MEAPAALKVTPLNAPHRELEYLPLVDKDFQIKDLCFDESPLLSYCRCRDEYSKGQDIIGLWESNLPRYLIPSVIYFPEIIHYCHSNYDPAQRAVIAPDQSVLFPITPQAINEMLHFEPDQELAPLSMEELIEKTRQLTPEKLKSMCQIFMLPEHQPEGSPPYSFYCFNQLGRLILNMISFVLGFNTSEYVDEITLVLLSIFTPGQPPEIKYDFASFIAYKIHDQFMRLDVEKVFKYSSVIYHLIIYYQSEKFPFPVQKLDAKGNPRSVIFWSSIIHSSSKPFYSYAEFIDQFVYPATALLTGSFPPRLSSEIKKTLQLSRTYKVGDWYLYQNHTVIRIYGCELHPFKLPRYVPMRIFALEYFRQMNNSDVIHFCSVKKKAQLRIKSQLGPFICNSREAEKEAEDILERKFQKSFRWVPYDPFGFICEKRLKNKSSPYIHHKIPELEQYANQDEWVEGTLFEEESEVDKMNKTMKDPEKEYDLESCGQVQVPQIGISSAATLQQVLQESSPSVAAETTGKGKEPEIQVIETLVMAEKSQTSKAPEQSQVSPTQVNHPQVQELQTPLNVEVGKKRQVPDTTPPKEPSGIHQAKKHKADPLPDMEVIDEVFDDGREDSQLTGTVSETKTGQKGKAIQKQLSTEVSSSRPPRTDIGDIKRTFINIKAKNDPLKMKVYDQYMKMAPHNQERLMSAFDMSQGKMIMSHFKSKVPKPTTAADYIRKNFEVLAEDIDPLDQIELHRQTGEMVFSTLINKAMAAITLRDSLNNTSAQLQIEKASSQAKDNRIKSLEEIIISLGHNPKDIKSIEALIKKKDDDIAALRKQLKLPASRHPQTQEVLKGNSQEEVMELLLNMTERLSETEKELEKTLQEQEIIKQTSTTGATTTGQHTQPAQVNTAGLSSDELVKQMESLQLRVTELQTTKLQLAKLEEKYDTSKKTVADNTREIKRLEKLVQALEKDLSLEKPLKEINGILWGNIIELIKDIWPSIQAIFEQNDLVKVAQGEIDKTRNELRGRPEQANQLIQFLNTRTKQQLAALGIEDRTSTVLEIKRVFIKRTFMQNLERKCADILVDINNFRGKFQALMDGGLPSPVLSEDQIMDLETYVKKINAHAQNTAACSTSLPVSTLPTGRSIYDRVRNLFHLEHEIKYLFPYEPTFYKLTEADETLRKLRRTMIPEDSWWNDLLEIL